MEKKIKKVSKFANNQFDFVLCITVLLLLALGLVMVLSASSPSSLADYGNSYHYFEKQAIFAVLGIIAMLILSKIDYRFYKRFYKIIYVASICMLLLVVIPKVGKSVNGAKRWAEIAGIRFQPSEFVKIGMIIFFATYLSEHKKKLSSLKEGFFKPFLILSPIILILLLIQDHLSASIVIIAVISIMMLMAGTRLLHFIIFGGAGAVAGATGLFVLAKTTSKGAFRIARITSFLNPWADKQGDGWQIIQSLYAIGSGGLFGVGLRRK